MNFTSGTSRILPASKFFVAIIFGMFLVFTSNYAGAKADGTWR